MLTFARKKQAERQAKFARNRKNAIGPASPADHCASRWDEKTRLKAGFHQNQ